MRKVSLQLVVFLFSLGIAAGCSTHTSTVKTVTIRYPAESNQALPNVVQFRPVSDEEIQDRTTQAEQGKQPVVVEEKTETTTETNEASVGLLSGAVHVVGQAIALPFHFVGGLIGLIF